MVQEPVRVRQIGTGSEREKEETPSSLPARTGQLLGASNRLLHLTSGHSRRGVLPYGARLCGACPDSRSRTSRSRDPESTVVPGGTDPLRSAATPVGVTSSRCDPDTYPPSGVFPLPASHPAVCTLSVADPPAGGASPSLPVSPSGTSGRSGFTPPCLRSTRRPPLGRRPDLAVPPHSPLLRGTRPGLPGFHPSNRLGVPERVLLRRQEASCDRSGRGSRGREEIPRLAWETHRQSPGQARFSTAPATVDLAAAYPPAVSASLSPSAPVAVSRVAGASGSSKSA